MRTKTILLTAAVLAAGLSASVAQSVFSVNAVGYVNVTIRHGYNLIANPLNNGGNTISEVLPPAALPDGLHLFGWDPTKGAVGDFANSQITDTGGWYDENTGLPSTTVIAPGSGFFIKVDPAGPITLTFVGDVPQGNLTTTIAAHYDIKGSQVPAVQALNTVGFPDVDGMLYQTFHNTGTGPGQQDYDQPFTNDAADAPVTHWIGQDGFSDVAPAPGVAQGFLLSRSGSVTHNWSRTFSVN